MYVSMYVSMLTYGKVREYTAKAKVIMQRVPCPVMACSLVQFRAAPPVTSYEPHSLRASFDSHEQRRDQNRRS